MTQTDILKIVVAFVIGSGMALLMGYLLIPTPSSSPPVPIVAPESACGTSMDGTPLPCGAEIETTSTEPTWYRDLNLTDVGPVGQANMLMEIKTWVGEPSHISLVDEGAETVVIPCGVYDGPFIKEAVLARLAEGVVWITYQPSLPAEEVQQLEQLATTEPALILSPNPQQPTPILLTTAGVQISLVSANDPTMAGFLAMYQTATPCTGD